MNPGPPPPPDWEPVDRSWRGPATPEQAAASLAYRYDRKAREAREEAAHKKGRGQIEARRLARLKILEEESE